MMIDLTQYNFDDDDRDFLRKPASFVKNPHNIIGEPIWKN